MTSIITIVTTACLLFLGLIQTHQRVSADSDVTARTDEAQRAGAAQARAVDFTSMCSPLKSAAGNVVRINAQNIHRIQSLMDAALPGDSFLFEDGYYDLHGLNLWISTPGINLRSVSGKPQNVILDGSYRSSQIISIAASNVTIAEITLKRAYTHPIHVVSSDAGDTLNTFIYRVSIEDPREQAIKINPHKPGHYVDNGTIACSSIILTDKGRNQVNPGAGGCYTGGIDAHQARNWLIRDNTIAGFWCPSGLSEYAIHFWKGSRDTVIERNLLKDNARAIGLGLLNRGKARKYSDAACGDRAQGYVGHYGGMLRNNRIYASSRSLFQSSAGFDCGICLWSACDTSVIHNSIVSTGDNFSSIEWRFPATRNASIVNNIATHSLRQRDGASATLRGNLQHVGLSLFADAKRGDLHLAPNAMSAINKGQKLQPGMADYDMDGERRDAVPDIGADER